MDNITFVDFSHINTKDLLPIVNKDSLRKHLIDHEKFTTTSLQEWINEKLAIDACKGCRIRAIYINDNLAGWCGIQPDQKGFELAIVISQQFWGAGILIFKTLMLWAKELGHNEVLFHLLDSRPEYKSLKRMATKVHKTELLGRCFTTYTIAVDHKSSD